MGVGFKCDEWALRTLLVRLQLPQFGGQQVPRAPDFVPPDLPVISSTSSSDPGPLSHANRGQAQLRDILNPNPRLQAEPPSRLVTGPNPRLQAEPPSRSVTARELMRCLSAPAAASPLRIRCQDLG